MNKKLLHHMYTRHKFHLLVYKNYPKTSWHYEAIYNY